MLIIEHPVVSSQAMSAIMDGERKDLEEREELGRPPIGSLLRSLREDRTLRQVEADTGISNAYLCNLEGGLKKPGVKTLSKLASYYDFPLQDLLQAAGLLHRDPLPSFQDSAQDVQRSYDFVMADPDFSRLRKPTEAPPIDFQRFLVEMYQHYTGKRLL